MRACIINTRAVCTVFFKFTFTPFLAKNEFTRVGYLFIEDRITNLKVT